MPGLYGVPDNEDGMLQWSHVEERMEASRNYWIGTAGSDGRPHSTPVWGVWFDGALYFEGGPTTRRGRHIAANPSVSVHLESGDEVVILEGEAYEIRGEERSLTTRLAEGFSAMYAASGYEPPPYSWDSGGLYRMTPRVAFAWTNFPHDTTRWHFD